jgi:hypothetical protein
MSSHDPTWNLRRGNQQRLPLAFYQMEFFEAVCPKSKPTRLVHDGDRTV